MSVQNQGYSHVPEVDDDHASRGQGTAVEPTSDGPARDGEDEFPNQEGFAYPPKNGDTPFALGTKARVKYAAMHLIPVGVSAYLIGINQEPTYWVREEDLPGPDYNDLRDILQFFAKIYELMVVTSLGAITTDLMKRRLIGGHVPLGLTMIAYRVSDIFYVANQFFFLDAWGRWLPLFMCLVLITSIATLAGPSSAILLIPEADWYPLPEPFRTVRLPFYYASAPEDTWPRVVTAARLEELGQLVGCNDTRGRYPYWCPAGGYPELQNWVSNWEIPSLAGALAFRDPTRVVRRQMAEVEHGKSHIAMTTVSAPALLTLSRFINVVEAGQQIVDDSHHRPTELIYDGAKFRLTSTATTPIFQPLVQTTCDAYEPAQMPSFNPDGIKCLGDPMCEKMLSRPWRVAGRFRNASGLEPSFQFLETNVSDDAPTPLFSVVWIPFQNGTRVDMRFFACASVAHWVPATLTVSPDESDLVMSNASDALANFYNTTLYATDEEALIRTGTLIRMDTGWTRYLLPSMRVLLANGTTAESNQGSRLFHALLTPFQAEGSNETVLVFNPAGIQDEGGSRNSVPDVDRAQRSVQRIVCAVVAEGLARVASASPSFVLRRRQSDTTVMALGIGRDSAFAHYVLDWSNGTGIRINSTGVQSDALDEVSRLAAAYASAADMVAALPRDFTVFDFKVEKYGYGVGRFGYSKTFALAVVYMYLAIVGLYFVYTLVVLPLGWGSSVPIVTAWKDLTDLLVLAWNSPKTANQLVSDSSVKIPMSIMWDVLVGIRGDPDTARTRLVTTDDGDDGVEVLRKDVPYT